MAIAADSALAASLRRHAGTVERVGSPFSGALIARIVADAEAGGPAADLLRPWAELDWEGVNAAVPGIRILAALHDLALSGEDPALTAAYPRPGVAGDLEAAWTAARAAMLREAARFADFMSHVPQTNEVGRAAMLAGGFLELAARTGLPLRCLEIGTSAGLNLMWDRFAYRLGELTCGDPGSTVVLEPDWSGPSPPDARIEVVERAGCDRRPVDISDPAQARRLLAFVFPDQPERIGRLKAAIDLAQAAGVKVERADAVDWVRTRAVPRPGAATVVYHSIFHQYLPAETAAALRSAIDACAAAASEEAPFAHLRMEPLRPADPIEVRLTLWPGGEDRRLGIVHPHGFWARWGEAADAG